MHRRLQDCSGVVRDAGALARCVSGRGDRDGALRTPFGGFDSGELEENKTGPFALPSPSFARTPRPKMVDLSTHGTVCAAARDKDQARLAQCTRAPVLGLIAEVASNLERLAVEGDRTSKITLGEHVCAPGS